MGEMYKTDLAVIGAGPGGYTAAFKAADLGKRVVLIDPEKNPGGVCLYRGCIPTKALLYAANLKNEAAKAKEFGITFKDPEVNIDKLRDFKNDVVKKLTGGVGQLTRQRKIKYIQGKAEFSGESSLNIIESRDSITEVEFEHAIIATGSHPVPLSGSSDFSSERLMYAEDALEIPDIPKTLLVIGAGYIGLEMSSFYASLGSEVTIIELTGQIMPGSDKELVDTFLKANKKLFKDILLNTRVENLEEAGNGIKVSFKSGDDDAESRTFEKVLLTVGRKANIESLKLDKAGVKKDGNGFISVDGQRRTNKKNIFAIGDVTGPPLLAHKASHEGLTAAEAAAGEKSVFEPKVIPSVEYCDPEIAWCGLSKEQAEEEGFDVAVTRFPWAASGRSITMGRSDGLTKMIIDKKSERILGVGIVGKDAGELIGEAALAIEMAALASDAAMTIHPHPTLSETLMEAAELFYGPATHVYKGRKKE